MSDTDLAYLPATEIRSMIAEKKVSSVEMTRLYLERIATLDSQFNSYLTVTVRPSAGDGRRGRPRRRVAATT